MALTYKLFYGKLQRECKGLEEKCKGMSRTRTQSNVHRFWGHNNVGALLSAI